MLLKHSAFYLFARGLPGIINFFALALFTRFLLPLEYGHYALIIAGVGLFNSVFFQWLRLGLLRFLPSYRENSKPLLSAILTGFSFCCLFTGIIGVLFLLFWPEPALRKLIGLAIPLLWTQSWFELNLEFARSQLSPLRYGLLSVTKAGLAFAIGILFIFLGFGVFGPLLGLLLGMFLAGVVLPFNRWKGNITFYIDKEIISKLLSYGLPLTATFALNFIISSSDRFIIGWLLGSEATGLYAAGYDLAQRSVGVLMMTVNLAAYPLAVQALEQKGVKAAAEQLKENATLLLAIALPAVVGMIMLSKNISGVVLGIEFQDAATRIIPWIAPAFFFSGLKHYYLDLSFQLGTKTIGQLWVSLIAAVINIVLNLFMIPVYGIIGAAYATLISFTVAGFLSYIWGKKVFPIPSLLHIDALKILLASAAMALSLLFVMSYSGCFALVGQIFFGASVYIALILVLNVAESRYKLKKILLNVQIRKESC